MILRVGENSTIENMIVYRTQAGQTPAWRNPARVEEQCAFDGAFPAVRQSNLADCHCIAPVFTASINSRHAVAAYKRKLAFLIDYAAEGGGKPP